MNSKSNLFHSPPSLLSPSPIVPKPHFSNIRS
jgi:hypothetical protein